MDANQKFDEATQRELQAFIEQEQAKARVQATTHQLTDMCWTNSEAYCLQNCVDRFLDTSLFIVKKLDEQRRSMQGGQ
ncbi:Mitochondrial import inner membrane translocase subunit tim8 [Rhizoctonia solani]